VKQTGNKMIRVTTAEITGEVPMVAFGFGLAPAYDLDLSYQDLKFMCAGNLDAPMLIAAGGVKIGFEDMLVARSFDRDCL
jgi:hypothetical protein